MVINRLMPTVLWLDDERNPAYTAGTYYAGESTPGEMTWVEKYTGVPAWECNILWAKSYDSFVMMLNDFVLSEGKLPAYICFDHDLGGQKTGLDCAKYLTDICILKNLDLSTTDIRYQSMNPSGARNMMSVVESYIKATK